MESDEAVRERDEKIRELELVISRQADDMRQLKEKLQLVDDTA